MTNVRNLCTPGYRGIYMRGVGRVRSELCGTRYATGKRTTQGAEQDSEMFLGHREKVESRGMVRMGRHECQMQSADPPQ